MNLSLAWRSLWARPTTILFVTPTTASLASFATPSTHYAALTPPAGLLDTRGVLVATFQLRTFLNEHLLPESKKPFSILLHIPPTVPEPLRLATQLTAILMGMGIPPFAATSQPISSATPASSLQCLVTGTAGPTARLLVHATFLAVASTFLCAAAAGAVWWHVPMPEEKIHTPPSAMQLAPATERPLFSASRTCIPLLCALALHAPSHQLVRISGSGKTVCCTTVTPYPAHARTAQDVMTEATGMEWSLKKPRYCAGYPPLYECTLRAKW